MTNARVLWGGLVAVMIATGCKDDSACPKAREGAADALVTAIGLLRSAHDALDREAQAAQNAAENLDRVPARFENKLKLLEQAMDCLAHGDDCCDRVGTPSQPAPGTIMLAAGAVFASAVELPELVRPAVVKLQNATEEEIGYNREEAGAWCKTARDAIAAFRRDAPPLWARVFENAKHEVKLRRIDIDALEGRQAVLQQWADAVKMNTRLTTIELDAGPTDLRKARGAITAYQAACH